MRWVLSVVLIAAGLMAVQPATSAQAATGNILPPFTIGESWSICQGYKSGTHSSDFSLDLTKGNNCADAGTTGSAARAVQSGTVYYVQPQYGNVCVNTDSGRSYAVLHLNIGVGGGQRVNAGQQIGTVAPPGAASNNGIAHIHLQMFSGPNCTFTNPASQVPFDSGHGARICGAPDLPPGGGGWNGQWSGTRFTGANCGPTVKNAIGARWRADGGASFWGEPTSEEKPTIKSGAYQFFQRGTIYWTEKTGAWGVRGGIWGAYKRYGSENGALGFPLRNEGVGTVAGVVSQPFEGGMMFWRDGVGGYYVRGGIRAAYAKMGAEKSSIGVPTSLEAKTAKAGGVYQTFQNGTIWWESDGSWHFTRGAISVRYKQLGGTGRFGFPASNEIKRNAGAYQNFDNGDQIWWSAATGAKLVKRNAIWNAWMQQRFDIGLGFPVAEQIDGLVRGGSYQKFQRGDILKTPSGKAWTVRGGILATWHKVKAENGSLGYPIGNEYLSNGIVIQKFERGEIHWTDSGGGKVFPKVNAALRSGG